MSSMCNFDKDMDIESLATASVFRYRIVVLSWHFGTKTVWHQDSLAPVQSEHKTLRHQRNWCQNVRTLWHQFFGAELFWCRSVWLPAEFHRTSTVLTHFHCNKRNI